MKKKLIMTIVVVAATMTGLAEIVTNVRGMQRENSHLVDIYYDLEASNGGSYSVKIEIEGRINEMNAAAFSGDIGGGVMPGKNRHVIWDAGADWLNKKGDLNAIVTVTKNAEKEEHGKVQLWAGGPYWATTNIGASNPSEGGLYFWWGDTTGGGGTRRKRPPRRTVPLKVSLRRRLSARGGLRVVFLCPITMLHTCIGAVVGVCRLVRNCITSYTGAIGHGR